jgi:hypothetical protein
MFGTKVADKNETQMLFSIYRMFQKELYNSIPNVTLWRVLRKHLYLKGVQTIRRSRC